MTYEKLTYSGTTVNNYLYFAFNADTFDTALVTRELGIAPTAVRIKQDPVPKSTTWKYEIEVGHEVDLVTPLHRLIDIFEPHIAAINQLKRDWNLKTALIFVIDIDINPEASTPYFGLSNRVIDFLGKTETEVDFDLYKADTVGLLDRL